MSIDTEKHPWFLKFQKDFEGAVLHKVAQTNALLEFYEKKFVEAGAKHKQSRAKPQKDAKNIVVIGKPAKKGKPETRKGNK